MKNQILKLTFYRQENLTKWLKFIENMSVSFFLKKMELGKIGTSLAAVSMLAMVNSSEAGEVKLTSTEEIDNPAFAQIIQNYQACVEAAIAKARTMKTIILKEKIFMGKMNGCDRKMTAEMGIIAENQKQSDLQDQQAASEARIAKITDNLITGAKNELGI